MHLPITVFQIVSFTSSSSWRDIIEVQRANTPKSDRIKRDKEGVLCEGMIRDSRKRQ
jgi:hypothetical protein